MTSKAEEAELAALEEELQELAEGNQLSSYGSPEPEKKDGVFKFFREILGLDESWKVGNLNNTEIGQPRHSIRKLLRIARYTNKEGLDEVSKYLRLEAAEIAATSMGRGGFLPQLFVTQIKKEQKIKEPTPQRKGFFGGRTNDTE